MSVKEVEGLTHTEYINLNNALKILQNWNDILSKLPENRQKKIQEQAKIFDPLIHLKKVCKDKNEIIHTTYNFSKSLKTYGRLFYSHKIHLYKAYQEKLEMPLRSVNIMILM